MASNLTPYEPRTHSNGKIIAVDPNPGREEGGQIVQPQEEYNIFVELKTFRRNRQKLVRNKKGEVESEPQNQGEETIINFIDGSNVGGERNLTSHYTELRTNFEDEQQDLETLGITSIDIEFNTSYTPMITINFTDVRGRLFEEGNESKYNIFFNLPYPLFSLTVKGYYGPPVSYCLHLTKFKSKFNSDTGNFEITTNFVGYTHAFLSDMLLGYVRAIGETKCGRDKLQAENKKLSFDIAISDNESSFERGDPKLPISINEFLNRTQKINKFIDSFKKDDEQIQQYIKANNIIDRLSEIEESINSLSERVTGLEEGDDTSVIDKGGDKPDREDSEEENWVGIFIIPKTAKELEVRDAKTPTEYVENVVENVKVPSEIKEQYEAIISEIERINEEEISSEEYQISIDNAGVGDAIQNNRFISTLISNYRDSDKSYLANAIIHEYPNYPNNRKQVTLIDFKTLLDKIQSKKNQLQDDSKNSLDIVSKKIQEGVQSEKVLGFRPTIANIIEIFSKNVEALMECINKTAEDAKENLKDNESLRRKKSEKISKKQNKGSELDTEEEFYPFPEYRENSGEKGSYEHAWIGKEFPDIEEVGFVESIIDGLLETKKGDKNRARNMREGEKGWIPIHPFDIVLNDENPWAYNFTTYKEVVELLNDRAALFLHGGYSLGSLSLDETKSMAKIEANNLFNNLSSGETKKLLKDAIIAKNPGQLNWITNNPSDATKGYLDKPSFDAFFEHRIPASRLNHRTPTGGLESKEDLILLSNLNLSFDSPSFNEFVDDIRIYTRTQYNTELSFSLPSYSGKFSGLNKSTFLGEGNENERYEVIFNSSDRGNSEAYHLNLVTDGGEVKGYSPGAFQDTKFNGDKNHTDYTKVKPKYPLSGSLRGSLVPTFITFYHGFVYQDENLSVPFIPFTTDYRIKEYKEIVKDFYDQFIDTGPPDIDLLRVDTKEFIDNTQNFHQRILSDERDKNDSDDTVAEGLPSGNAEKNLAIASLSNSEVPIPFLGITDRSKNIKQRYYNIFGTQLYYEQNRASDDIKDFNKAFLFLNCIPFKGYTFSNEELANDYRERVGFGEYVFGNRMLENLFNVRSSFVSVPYAWILYIGALLWRREKDEDPIILKKEAPNGKEYSVFPNIAGNPAAVSDSAESYIKRISFDGAQFSRQEEVLVTNFPSFEIQFPDDFFKTSVTYLDKNNNDDNIRYLDTIHLSYLPEKVKNEFKGKFERWVGNGWQIIKNQFEIFKEEATTEDIFEFRKAILDSNDQYRNLDVISGEKGNHPNVNFENINRNYLILGTINNIPFDINGISVNDFENQYTNNSELGEGSVLNFFLEFQDPKDANIENSNSDNSSAIREFMLEERIIANPSPFTFRVAKDNTINTDEDLGNDDDLLPVHRDMEEINGEPVYTSEGSYYRLTKSRGGIDEELINEITQEYFNAFHEEFKKLDTPDSEETKREQALKQEIFNSLDNNDIKLSIYQDIKNIYDKWVAGIGDEQSNSVDCGPFIGGLEESGDKGLFDSFRFLDRSFNDIRDKLLVNPMTITSFLTENLNTSFYSFLSRILGDNNMNFIPLPNYVDFTSEKDLKKIFRPFTFSNEMEFSEETRQGPTFVCMYVGEKSNSLDLGNSSDYENDGFDIKLNSDGDIMEEELPKDYTKGQEDEVDPDNKVPVFFVNFADQNQSVFQNLNLDQSEFTETNESLVVQERISQRGAPTSRNMQGQNLYDVYQKRAYHCDIDALGAAFIQPLMQFQLNNVPMFHGTYMIIKVSHNIKPNHMTTNFQGVRVGRIRTPFVEEETVFMNIIGSLSDLELDDDIKLAQGPLTSSVNILNASNNKGNGGTRAEIDVED